MNNIFDWFSKFYIALIPIAIVFSFIMIPIIFHLLQKRKGTIKISLNKLNYELGESIDGQIVIFSKKEQVCERLTIELCCWEKISNSNKSNNYLLYETKEIIARNVQLFSQRKSTFSFSIKSPSEIPKKPSIDLGEVLPGLSKYLPKISGGRLVWELKSNAELEGLDLYAHEKIYFPKT